MNVSRPLPSSARAARRRLTAIAALLCLATPSALYAQSPPGTPSQGLPLPDRSLSAQDDVASVEVNPAGLGFMQNAELQYNLQLATSDYARTVPAGHALFGGFGLGGFGLGFGAQFLFNPDIGSPSVSGDYRKYTIAGALGDGDSVSLGLAYNFFGSSSSQRLDALKSVDVGAQVRLSSWLGLGLFARDLNAPFLDDAEALNPRWGAGVILRLWDGRLQFEQQVEHVRRNEFVTLTPRLVLEAVRGLRLFARSAFTVSSSSASGRSGMDQTTAGIEVSLGGIGAQAAMTIQQSDGASISGHGYTLWLANNKKRAVFDITERWILIDLATPYSELPVNGLFSTPSSSFVKLITDLDRIAADPSIEGIVFNIANPGLGYAQIWELRQRIDALQSADKKTVAVLQNADTKSVLLSGTMDKVFLTPNTVYEPTGLNIQVLNYKDALENIGLNAEFLRIRDYKSAPEAYIRDSPSEEALSQTSAYLDAIYQAILTSVAADRNKTPEQVKQMIDATPLLPDEALTQGYIDGIIYPDEVEEKLQQTFGKRIVLSKNFSPQPTSEERWERHPEVAILVISGAITQGGSGASPLSEDSLSGSDTIVGALERLRKDRNVRAVVLRVDSPGGSALASDQIYRELRRLAQKKPVVASMGDVAASGGYYVAAGADEIFATPLTLTGSIGIFTGKVSLDPLASKVGVNTTTLARGERSGAYSLWTPLTEGQRAYIAKYLIYLYRLFLTQIANTRDLTPEEIDQVARGHIWGGEDAIERKLVDQSGGLIDAIRHAEELAGLRPRQAKYGVYPRGGGLLFSGGASATGELMERAKETLKSDEQKAKEESLRQVTALLTRSITAIGPNLLLPLLYEPGEALMLPPVAIEIE